MKLEIISVHNHGDYDKEYVRLQAREDCDVGRYLLADTTYTNDGKVSNKLRHTYWFPDKNIKKGDLVCVWTKPGANATTSTSTGTPIHHFYWNLQTAVWNDEGDCAALLETNTWQFFKARG
jgi:hypothetical protein